MVQSGYTEARDDSREKNEEGQGNKTAIRRCFSYSRTMVIDRREDPLCGESRDCIFVRKWKLSIVHHLVGQWVAHGMRTLTNCRHRAKKL